MIKEKTENVGKEKKPETMKNLKKLGIRYNPGKTILVSLEGKLDEKGKRMWKNIWNTCLFMSETDRKLPTTNGERQGNWLHSEVFITNCSVTN